MEDGRDLGELAEPRVSGEGEQGKRQGVDSRESLAVEEIARARVWIANGNRSDFNRDGRNGRPKGGEAGDGERGLHKEQRSNSQVGGIFEDGRDLRDGRNGEGGREPRTVNVEPRPRVDSRYEGIRLVVNTDREGRRRWEENEVEDPMDFVGNYGEPWGGEELSPVRRKQLDCPLFSGIDPDGYLFRMDKFFSINRLLEREKLITADIALEGVVVSIESAATFRCHL